LDATKAERLERSSDTGTILARQMEDDCNLSMS